MIPGSKHLVLRTAAETQQILFNKEKERANPIPKRFRKMWAEFSYLEKRTSELLANGAPATQLQKTRNLLLENILKQVIEYGFLVQPMLSGEGYECSGLGLEDLAFSHQLIIEIHALSKNENHFWDLYRNFVLTESPDLEIKAAAVKRFNDLRENPECTQNPNINKYTVAGQHASFLYSAFYEAVKVIVAQKSQLEQDFDVYQAMQKQVLAKLPKPRAKALPLPLLNAPVVASGEPSKEEKMQATLMKLNNRLASYQTEIDYREIFGERSNNGAVSILTDEALLKNIETLTNLKVETEAKLHAPSLTPAANAFRNREEKVMPSRIEVKEDGYDKEDVIVFAPQSKRRPS